MLKQSDYDTIIIIMPEANEVWMLIVGIPVCKVTTNGLKYKIHLQTIEGTVIKHSITQSGGK